MPAAPRAKRPSPEPVIEVPAGLMESILGFMAHGGGPAGSATSAGIPVNRSALTMTGAQKFRADYYKLDRKVVGGVARLVSERNWFAREVHRKNKAYYGSGFRLRGGKTVAEWASAYPFQRIHDDVLHEWLVSDCAIAYWRKTSPSGSLPWVEIPDSECVDYSVIGGVEQIEVRTGIHPKSKVSEETVGKRMYEALTKKGKLVIPRYDPDFDFAVMKFGKSGSGLPMPSSVGVLDDLDFIECVKVGDWNGAYARREILRVTKKGSGVSSGPNAGTTRLNAKAKDLRAIAKYMKEIAGKQDLAVNWDQDTAWITFGKEFFGEDIMAGALRRLIFWGGLGAITLLKTDSQMAGMSSLLYDTIRAQVLDFRKDAAVFLKKIWNSPSFLNGNEPPQPLEPMWSVKPLYTVDGFTRIVASASERAWIDPKTIREEYWEVDDEETSDRMREAHANREDYTPPYEPRQGLLPGLFPADYQTGSSPSATSADGNPGRPANPV